ncbi:MAG: aldolase/citrate lyase family protein [Chloroflexota bacterium]|nr:aldolase/citrate lyase family protein [Chloroflexota bacterium]
MLATSTLVRRSVLVVSLVDSSAVEECWRHNADAIVLELPDTGRQNARVLLPAAVEEAGRGGAEVFVRIDPSVAYADLKAAVVPGLGGVVLPDAESARDVAEVGDMLQEREREVGIRQGALELFPLLGTATGVWNVREVIKASPRTASVAIDEVRLSRAMGIVPTDEFDPLGFSRGRVIVETLAATLLPLGIGHPLGADPRQVDHQEVLRVAERARNTGFKGALCAWPAWVGACNTAFTPSQEQVAYYREVRVAFAQGVARGTAAVPFPGGRMIDVPVDARAKLVIDWWDRCQRRDAAKAAATRASLA